MDFTIQINDDLFTREVNEFANEAAELIDLYAKKNNDYGNSFDKGMKDIGMAYGVGRIYDKVGRLVNLTKHPNNQKVNESIDDTLKDLACYSIMMLRYLHQNKN